MEREAGAWTPRGLALEYRQALDRCTGPNGSSWSEQPKATKDYPEPSIQMALRLIQAGERGSLLTAFEEGPRGEAQIIGGPSPHGGREVREWCVQQQQQPRRRVILDGWDELG